MNSVPASRALPGAHSLQRHRRLSGPGGGCCWELRTFARSLSSASTHGASRSFSSQTFSCTLRRGTHQPGPTAWTRSGVESGCKLPNSYLFLLPDSVCAVHDRPHYSRVKGEIGCVRGKLPNCEAEHLAGRVTRGCEWASRQREYKKDATLSITAAPKLNFTLAFLTREPPNQRAFALTPCGNRPTPAASGSSMMRRGCRRRSLLQP